MPLLALGPWQRFSSTSTALGRRKEQQDAAFVYHAAQFSVAAVMDGHGSEGALVAQCVQQKLTHLFETTLSETIPLHQTLDSWKTWFTSWLLQLHTELIEEVDCYLSGTTLCLCILTSRQLVVANMGDSGALLLSKINSGFSSTSISASPSWQFQKLTRDHTCENPEELARVLASGARVERSIQINGDTQIEDGPLRIYKGSLPYPGLVVTRTLGDTVARSLGVLSEPEVFVFPFPNLSLASCPSQAHFLIVASDGVWDALSPTQLTELIPSLLNSSSTVSSLSQEPNKNKTCSSLLNSVSVNNTHFMNYKDKEPSLEKAIEMEHTIQSCSKGIIQAADQRLDQLCIDDNLTVICVLFQS